MTWPVTTPARIALVSRVPGGGDLEVQGTARMQPAAADVRVRLTGTELAPWSQFMPAAGRVTGTAAADLAIRARLEGQLSARANGTVSLARLAVHDRDRTPATIERIDVSGLAWEYPSQVVVERVVVRRPSALVERDAAGRLKLVDLLRPDGAASGASASPAAPDKNGAAPPLAVTVRQVRLEDGAIQWRDAAVKPAARADIGAIQLVVTDVAWPWRGPAPLRLSARAPGGGTLDARGTVNAAPVAADLRLALRGADIAPYQPYVGYPVKIAGRGSAELQLTLSGVDPLAASVRGRAELTQAAVASEAGPIVSVPRAEVADIAAEWPQRVRIGSVRVERPMAMVERTADGRMPARDVFARRPASDRPAAGAEDAPSASVADEPARPLAVEVGRVVVSRGAARFVDRTVSPAYSEELSALDVELAGLTTAASTPAKLRLTSRVGPTGAFEVNGTIAAFGEYLYVAASSNNGWSRQSQYDASMAIAGRFVPLLLARSWLGQEDHELELRLREELSAILNWSLDGLESLAANGRFTRPPGADELARRDRHDPARRRPARRPALRGEGGHLGRRARHRRQDHHAAGELDRARALHARLEDRRHHRRSRRLRAGPAGAHRERP